MSDSISRKAVLNTLDTMDKALDEDRTVEAYKELLKECYKALPRVTPKQRTGKWIEFDHGWGLVFLKCPFCGEFQSKADNHNFCPNCGAKMEGVSE